jgi:hypothetical protein
MRKNSIALAAAAAVGLPAGTGTSLEYGGYALAHDDYDSFYFRLSASPVLLAEYSRTSQHPFINRPEFSQAATDILMLGLSFPEIRAGAFSDLSYLRLGYEGLFHFWQSGLPESRASWTLKGAFEARLSLGKAWPPWRGPIPSSSSRRA